MCIKRKNNGIALGFLYLSVLRRKYNLLIKTGKGKRERDIGKITHMFSPSCSALIQAFFYKDDFLVKVGILVEFFRNFFISMNRGGVVTPSHLLADMRVG